MLLERLEGALTELRQVKPLVLNLTNYVSMDLVANGLLALGALPIMTVCTKELEELVLMAHSLTLNIGTLDSAFMERCLLAGALSKKHHKPLILDPVGAGATNLRTSSATQLLAYAGILKGNASEIMALSSPSKVSLTLGVESRHQPAQAREAAEALAKQHGCTVVISGPVDQITDGQKWGMVPYGTPMMTKVTGMGCALAAIIAAFHGVMRDRFEASLLATTYFGLCGALAARNTTGPATFRSALIDALAHSTKEEWQSLI